MGGRLITAGRLFQQVRKFNCSCAMLILDETVTREAGLLSLSVKGAENDGRYPDY
jgi:hypothetical protein